MGVLSKLRSFLPQDARHKLYYALIHSHRNYRIWGYTSIPVSSKTKQITK